MPDLVLQLLGGFEARTADGRSLSFPTKKTKALLAYLSVEPGKSYSRSELAALLWGSGAEEQARANLRQTLSELRRSLAPTGREHLIVREDLVAVDPTTVTVDAAALEDLSASGDPERFETLVELYRGDFLSGFDLREEGFNDWLRVERARLHELGKATLTTLMDHYEASGDVARAIRVANRLLALDPLQEHAHRSLMRLHISQGERALALKQFEVCREVLKREVDSEPDEETRKIWNELRAARSEPREGVRRVPGAAVRTSPGRWRRHAIAAAAFVLFASAAVWLMLPRDLTGDGEEFNPPDNPSIAVLPFEDLSDDAEWSWFAEGFTGDIIADLSRFSNLFVISSESSSRYRDVDAAVEDIAHDLRVRYLLKGNLQVADATLSIRANLIDAATGQLVWAEQYERPTENIFAVQKEIARTIAAVVGSDQGEVQRVEAERIRRIPTKDLQAYGYYVRGVELNRWETRKDNALAREMFEKAIEVDPNYARAIAKNSLTYLYDVFQGWTESREQWLQRAEDLARRAIAIDRSEPWGFVALGVSYQAQARNDEAISLFETAYALNPNDFYITTALGYAVTFAGSAERGVELLEKAQRLNPYSTEEPSTLVWAYFFAGRYHDALEAINRITRRRSDTYWIYKAAVHAELHQMDEAQAAIAEALKLNPELSATSENRLRLSMGLTPAYAEQLTNALRKAGLPE